MRLLSPLLFMLIIVSALPATAQTYPNTASFSATPNPDDEWYGICMRVEHAAPPLPPRGTGPTACDASAAYYLKLDQASTSTAEWAAVRNCALASHDTAVLSMLYANGLGVPRDTEAAIHYACSTAATLDEMGERVMRLSELPHLSTLTRYDQCDDRVSGSMLDRCAFIANTRAARINTAYFAKLRATLQPNQVAPFDRLVNATRVFARTHAQQETGDFRGSFGYAGIVMDAERREVEWLSEYLSGFEKGRISLPAPTRFLIDDAELNRVYALRTRSAAHDDDAKQAVEGMRAAQRSWLAYRDAWVAFAALRYPRMPADSLKGLLTQWRIKQL